MRMPVLEETNDVIASNPFDSRTIQRWSAPQIILVVSDLLDTQTLQFHAIQQARQSGARILLVEVDESFGSIARTRHLHGLGPDSTLNDPTSIIERMAINIQRTGVQCEPVIVRGLRPNEIPAVARSCCADRVLVSAPMDANGNGERPAILDVMTKEVNVPICVVGRDLSMLARYQKPSRKITLLLSLQSKNDIPITFCSRLAQEIHSQLTIMLVFPQGARDQSKTEDVCAIVASHLSPRVLKEAGFRCPIEISVREGDPATAVLNYESRLRQDFLVVAPFLNADLSGNEMRAATKICRRAQCPVIVLADHPNFHRGHSRNVAETYNAGLI